MLSQIAIALTGYQILSEIANTQLAFPLDKLYPYVMDCISRFKSYKNPIEKLLDAFPILIWNSNITYGNQLIIYYSYIVNLLFNSYLNVFNSLKSFSWYFKIDS